jgi:hypothetical protein
MSEIRLWHWFSFDFESFTCAQGTGLGKPYDLVQSILTDNPQCGRKLRLTEAGPCGRQLPWPSHHSKSCCFDITAACLSWHSEASNVSIF